jgi:hypothetical protein
MGNIKVIQHIHGIEHITDKLETKSIELTNEFIGNFRRKDSLTFQQTASHSIDTINTPSI